MYHGFLCRHGGESSQPEELHRFKNVLPTIEFGNLAALPRG
jgi:hypothetical protein